MPLKTEGVVSVFSSGSSSGARTVLAAGYMDSQDPVSVDTVEVSMHTISSFWRCFSSLEGGFSLPAPS